MEDMVIDCPVCGAKEAAKSTMKIDNIPYFGEIMESLVVCGACGFKHNDVICLDQDEPSEYKIKINNKNLNTRVVKSQSATMMIPDFGLKVEPGPKSEGFISNVEGVIVRFQEVLKSVDQLFDDEESKKNAKKILSQLDELLNGKTEAILILKDPFGQSKILDLKAEKRLMSEDEIENLKTGFTTFDYSEIE